MRLLGPLLLVDYVATIDFDRPEKLGEKVWPVHSSVKISVEDGKVYRTDKVQLKSNIVDVSDYEFYEAHLVLGGRAIYYTQPSIDGFALLHHGEVAALERHRCERSEEAVAAAANAILKDPDRRIRKSLFHLPENWQATTDFWSAEPEVPISDMKIPIEMRDYNRTETINIDEEHSLEFLQGFHPFSLKLRIIDEDPDQNVIEVPKEEKQMHKLVQMMQGQSISK